MLYHIVLVIKQIDYPTQINHKQDWPRHVKIFIKISNRWETAISAGNQLGEIRFTRNQVILVKESVSAKMEVHIGQKSVEYQAFNIG
jgi:hypothetical protein